MADKVHPSAKPTATAAAAVAVDRPPIPKPPPAKTQSPLKPTRHPYRPIPTPNKKDDTKEKPERHFSCRRSLRLSCFWVTLLLLVLILLTAIAAAAFYALYQPRGPAFSVTSVKISYFNLSAAADDGSAHLATKLNLTISVKNPNKKKIAFFFNDPISITAFSRAVKLSNGSLLKTGSSDSEPGSIFLIHGAMASNSEFLETDAVNSLKSDAHNRKRGLPMKIEMETMMGVKLEKLKVRKKIGIRVDCGGIRGVIPKSGKHGMDPAPADVSKAKCKVDLRVKMFIWTF